MKREVTKVEAEVPGLKRMVTLNADKLGKLIKDSANSLEAEKNK
jgi:hypothetical protein